MCGIAGIHSEDPIQRGQIGRMLQALIHRGPDDEGIVAEGSTVLGQRRLSIIDLDGGRQPIANDDGTAWIVCNGEIYNYKSLRLELKKEGYRFRTHSDTEVILALYEREGVNCLKRLRGMFAFAIWDSRTQQLFCARDHLGQKPFYYATRDNGLLFGSEIKALLAADDSLRQVNLHALDQYLSLRIVTSPRSMFRDVLKLPPAHYLTFSKAEGLKVKRYWDLNYEPKWPESERELMDALEDQLIETLRLHMVSDVPVGAFLSGGLDSTLLVAILSKRIASEPLQTFTFGLPYKEFDESSSARLVAETYGTEHNEYIVRPSLLKHIDQLVAHMDEPSDPLSVCMLLLAKFAAEKVKVVIGGDGGDELFGGYDRYYGQSYAAMYASIPEVIRSKLLGPMLRQLPDGTWYKSKAHQLKWLQALSFLDGPHRYAKALNYFYFREEMRRDLYGPVLAHAAHTLAPEADLLHLFSSANATETVDRMLYTDSFTRLPDHPVMISDRMTMAYSLECRSPFLDHRLVEFSARLPVRMKVRGRTLRYAQRKLAARYLPNSVLKRPKQGFASALPYMLKDEYEQLFTGLLRKSVLAEDGLLRQKAIDDLVIQHRAGKIDHGNRLWLLVSSEAWYRVHIKGSGSIGLGKVVRPPERNQAA